MSTVTSTRPSSSRPQPSRSRSAPATRAATIDPFRVLRRHMLRIVAAGLFGLILGGVAWFLLGRFYPLYSAEVLFEVQPGVASASEVGSQADIDEKQINQMSQTQIVLLKSREIVEAAVKMPEVLQTEWFKTNFMDEDSGQPMFLDAADELEETLRASVIRETQLFQVRWMTHVKEDVPVVLNAVAQTYMTARRSLDNQVYNENYKRFREQLERTNQEIEDLDQEIEAYIREVGITSLDDPRYTQFSMRVQQLTQLISESQQRLSLGTTNYGQTAAKLQGTLDYEHDDIQIAEQDFGYANLQRETDMLSVEVRALRTRYPSDAPQVRLMEDRLSGARTELAEKREEIIRRNLNAGLKLYGDEVERTQEMLETLEAELEDEDLSLRELASKQSTYEALRERREYLEGSRDSDSQLIKEIQLLRVRSDASRVRIAYEASTPRERSFPRAGVIIPLGFLLMVGLTVGIVFVRELTDQRVKTASDLAVLPGAKIIGVVPEVDEDPTKVKAAELVIRRFPESVLAESYRQACTPLIKAMDHSGHQTMLIASGLPAAGTTTAISNIAAGLAATGRSVVVVDANFRRPRLAEVMGVDTEKAGLGDVLGESVTLDDALSVGEYGVHVLGAGTPGSRVIERLNTERMDSVIAELRGRFDVVIFDAPPAVVAGETMVLANKVDCAVLVVRANQEQRGLVARLMNQFHDAHCQLLGVMLNRPRGTAGGYFKKNYATIAAYGGSGA